MTILSIITFALVVYCFYLLQRERKRVRMLSAFIAGTIRYVTHSIRSNEVLPAEQGEYKKLLDSVVAEFCEDYWVNPFKQFLKKDRNLFYDGKLSNNGFNWMYWDFYDKCYRLSGDQGAEGEMK